MSSSPRLGAERLWHVLSLYETPEKPACSTLRLSLLLSFAPKPKMDTLGWSHAEGHPWPPAPPAPGTKQQLQGGVSVRPALLLL